MSSLFAISDLHLCDKGSRDNFIVRGEDRFLRFLDYVDHEQGTRCDVVPTCGCK